MKGARYLAHQTSGKTNVAHVTVSSPSVFLLPYDYVNACQSFGTVGLLPLPHRVNKQQIAANSHCSMLTIV